MRIETTRFGPLELEEKMFIQFPWGIPGFEKVKRYVLLEHRQGPFQWLQAVDEPGLAFLVCPPEALGLTYRVPQEKEAVIGIEHLEDRAVLVMLSVDPARHTMRPHLHGPLLFNAASRQGYQWTLDSLELETHIVKTNGEDRTASAPSAG